MRVVLHVDMDAFFAAVEQREHPELKGRPVVVGADPRRGQGRGVVSTCSYEARPFGVHSAQPISQAWRLCPQAAYLPPNGKLYAAVSRRIMSVLAGYTDLLEKISIDEAFLDVTASYRLHGSGEQIARAIRDRILRQEELTASVGVAGNKFIAKIASDLDKPDGLVVVPPGTERRFLAPLPLSRIWGVGKKTGTALKSLGCEKIGQVAALPAEILEKRLGKQGRRLWELANGIDERPVMPYEEAKSIGHEITYDEDTLDPELWHATLLGITERVARRLRKSRKSGRTVTLKVRFDDFSTFTRRKTGRDPISTGEEIFPLVERLFGEFARQGRKIRLLGVYVSQFEPRSESQKSLFDFGHERLDSLSEAVDRIEDRFGQGVVRRARLLKN